MAPSTIDDDPIHPAAKSITDRREEQKQQLDEEDDEQRSQSESVPLGWGPGRTDNKSGFLY